MNTKNKMNIPPAQLFIGPHKIIVEQAQKELQAIFCPDDGCGKCITCKKIENRQYHGALWTEPEKNYTLDLLEPIFKRITFALDQGKQTVFIIQKADFLTTACSNSLLKSVEEPPPGYHFLFLAERSQQILPTIRSRCTLRSFYSVEHLEQNSFASIFKSKPLCAPSVFLRTLSQANPSERLTIEYLDELLAFWLELSKKAAIERTNKQNNVAMNMVRIIKTALLKPPMPGSSKLFWKNFYLQAKNVQKKSSRP